MSTSIHYMYMVAHCTECLQRSIFRWIWISVAIAFWSIFSHIRLSNPIDQQVQREQRISSPMSLLLTSSLTLSSSLKSESKSGSYSLATWLLSSFSYSECSIDVSPSSSIGSGASRLTWIVEISYWFEVELKRRLLIVWLKSDLPLNGHQILYPSTKRENNPLGLLALFLVWFRVVLSTENPFFV